MHTWGDSHLSIIQLKPSPILNLISKFCYDRSLRLKHGIMQENERFVESVFLLCNTQAQQNMAW